MTDSMSCAMQDNLYQLGMLTHLQCPDVPLKQARVLRDLKLMYEVAAVEDLYEAYAEVRNGGIEQREPSFRVL